MSTPLPGQIRCPTCHRSTPPAAFCTQCGTPIPASARARPRGLDREELQDRIRTHRPGDAAFRRGSPVGEGSEPEYSPYQPFRPEPEDELIIPGGEAAEAGAAHLDNTPPGYDDQPPSPPPTIVPPIAPSVTSPPPGEPRPAPWRPTPAPIPDPPPTPRIVEPELPAQQWTAPDEPYVAEPYVAEPYVAEPYAAAEPYNPRYRPRDDDWGRPSSGISPLAIGGFVLLGVLAIAVGAFVSGIFTGGVASGSPTPTPLASVSPSTTPVESAQPSAPASVPGSPNASGGPPGTFPDGFTARTQPCIEEPASQDGCDSSGASVTGGSVWAWIGFRKGNSNDVLGVSIVDASGASVGDGSLALGSIGCGDSCSGWGRFKFGGLAPGNYTIKVNRNGQPAAEAPFTVTA